MVSPWAQFAQTSKASHLICPRSIRWKTFSIWRWNIPRNRTCIPKIAIRVSERSCMFQTIMFDVSNPGGVYLPQRIERSFLPFYGSSGEQYSRQAFVKKGWSNDLEVVGVFTVQFLSAFPSCSRILKDAPFIIVLSLSFSVPSTILAIVLICTVIFMPSMWKEM